MTLFATRSLTALRSNARPPAPKIEVICPPLFHAPLEAAEHSVRQAIACAHRRADAQGRAAPLAILFAENALHYQFNISSDEVMRAVERMQKDFPSDSFISVAFAVWEMRDENGLPAASNSGYLFSATQISHSPKRNLTDFDKNGLKCFDPADAALEISMWERRKKEMEAEQAPFPQIRMPGGVGLELRICLDASAKPLAPAPNLITLVSAHSLHADELKELSRHRLAVAVHDSGTVFPKHRILPSNVWASNRRKFLWKELHRAGLEPHVESLGLPTAMGQAQECMPLMPSQA